MRLHPAVEPVDLPDAIFQAAAKGEEQGALDIVRGRALLRFHIHEANHPAGQNGSHLAP